MVTNAVSAKDSFSIMIAVEPVNNPPELRVPGEILSTIHPLDPSNMYVSSVQTVTINEDEVYYLSGVTVIDVDSFPLQQCSLRITTAHGTIPRSEGSINTHTIV
jgi:hypothetical protein